MTKAAQSTPTLAGSSIVRNPLDLTADDIVECILKREGGTIVEFGFHNKKKVKYHFRPIDATDPESPHVCNVSDDDHYGRFLSISECYREFDPDGEYQPVYSLSKPSEDDDYDSRNNFYDLLSVNPDDVSNEWLGQFAETILKIKVTQKQNLADMATTQYGLEFDYSTTTAVEIVRMILVECIKAELAASESA